MTRTPEEVEPSLEIPADVAEPAIAATQSQDAARGDWESPRGVEQPDPPWPAEDSAMLGFLLHKAQQSIDEGMEPKFAMLQLAVHAWFEGGVENYDRGQRDARRPRPVS